MNISNPRVGIYLRVSTLEQSTELQAREIKEYLEARGWAIATIYEDAGRSGTNGNRPALKKLLQDARSRKIDLIVSWKLDRVFRSLKDLILTLNEFHDLGIAFISLRDQIDMTTSSGRLMLGILGSFAQFEADLIRERVRAGLANARAKGKHVGRPPRINAADVYILRERGLSLSQIAKHVGRTKGAVSKVLAKDRFRKSGDKARISSGTELASDTVRKH